MISNNGTTGPFNGSPKRPSSFVFPSAKEVLIILRIAKAFHRISSTIFHPSPFATIQQTFVPSFILRTSLSRNVFTSLRCSQRSFGVRYLPTGGSAGTLEQLAQTTQSAHSLFPITTSCASASKDKDHSLLVPPTSTNGFGANALSNSCDPGMKLNT